MEDTDLKLIVVISKLNKVLSQRLEPEIKDFGITFTQFTVLEALYHKGALTVNALIEKTLSSSGNIGLVINNLQKAGLITKRVSLTDKRSREIIITSRGSELIKELFPKHVSSITTSFSGLSEEEKEVLIGLIKKLGKSIGGKDVK